MTINRIVTDVPVARVGFVVSINQAAGGLLVSQHEEEDGEFTLVFQFPDSASTAIQPPMDQAFTDVVGDGNDATTSTSVVASEPVAPALVTATDVLPSVRWLAVAKAELGVNEVEGVGDNPRIVAFHASTDGGDEPDSVPWCSSFVNFCVQHAGLKGTRSKAARSWMQWGRPSGFVPGAIVVLKRGVPPKGHVGFFVGIENGRLLLLGGNQGDRVSVASFDPSLVLACRISP